MANPRARLPRVVPIKELMTRKSEPAFARQASRGVAHAASWGEKSKSDKAHNGLS
jgi:hypothetical protein